MEDKIILTGKGLRELRKKIDELESEYARISRTKAEAAEQGGNVWHDNPAFEEVEAKQRTLSLEIAQLKNKLHQAIIVEGAPRNKKEVSVGSVVEISFSDGKTKKVKIGGYAESDPGKNVVSYQTPLGSAILGAKIGEMREYQIAGKTIKVVVKNIIQESKEEN